MKIFLGYPSEFEKTAWEVYNFLRLNDDEIWFDKVALNGGVEWDRERDEGQRNAELVIHLCSKSILSRAGVVNREIRQTLRLVEDQPLGSLYVIPIRLEPIKLPVELTRFQYFDFEAGWEHRLADAVERRRKQLEVARLPTDMEKRVKLIAPAPVAKSIDAKHEVEAHSTMSALTDGDVTKVEFQDVTEIYECRGEYIRYKDEGLYWTFVNGKIASAALDGYFSARGDFGRNVDERIHELLGAGEMNEWSINTEEFYRSGDMVSIRYYTFIGYAGAAHPSHYITTLNFFGEKHGSISIKFLLGYSEEMARKIMNYCEKILVAQFEDEIDGDSFLSDYAESSENLWKLLSQYSFDNKGMTFNFSPYDVLPFVLGSHEIQVPWHYLYGKISEEYQPIFDDLATRK